MTVVTPTNRKGTQIFFESHSNQTITMKKIAFITGATSGIGQACAQKFAASGYNLIINGRNTDKLNEMRETLTQSGVEVLTLPFDVLVNNAGLALGLDKEYEGDFEDWDTMIDTNIKGLLHVTRMVVPAMVARNRGHVINIGSVAGDAAYANGNVYCATKAAVKTITDGLRIDLAHTAVRVTNVKPGLVETNFSVVRFHGDKERADNVYKGIQPLTGDDIADVVLYAANAPEHVQIAEVLVLATHQANGSTIVREA